MATGDVRGWGFSADATTVAQVAAALNGAEARWTHPGSETLARHLGHWRNPRVVSENGRELAVADLEFSPTAHHLQPDGLLVPAPTYLMDRAEEQVAALDAGGLPRSFGVSIHADLTLEQAAELRDGSPVHLARVAPGDLWWADVVGQPAANHSLSEGQPMEDEKPDEAEKDEAKTGDDLLDQLEALGLTPDEILDAAKAAAAAKESADETEAADGDEDEDEKDKEEADMSDGKIATQLRRVKAQLSQKGAEVSALRTTVDALKAAEAVRAARDVEAFLSDLKKSACSAGSAIPEADVAKVEAAFADGNTDGAHTLADAFLTRSVALGGGKAGKVVKFATGDESEAAIDADLEDFHNRRKAKA